MLLKIKTYSSTMLLAVTNRTELCGRKQTEYMRWLLNISIVLLAIVAGVHGGHHTEEFFLGSASASPQKIALESVRLEPHDGKF